MNIYAISRRRNALRALTDTALLERADELNRQFADALADDWAHLPNIRHELNELGGIVLERAVTTKRLPELHRLEGEHGGDRFVAYRALLTT